MHPVEITLECPDCDGRGKQGGEMTGEYQAALKATATARKAEREARIAYNNEDYDAFAEDQWHQGSAMFKSWESARHRLAEAVKQTQRIPAPYLPDTPCQRCNATGKVTAPVRLDTALSWIVGEMARLDKGQTGGEPNAKRIFQALELSLAPFPTTGE